MSKDQLPQVVLDETIVIDYYSLLLLFGSRFNLSIITIRDIILVHPSCYFIKKKLQLYMRLSRHYSSKCNYEILKYSVILTINKK